MDPQIWTSKDIITTVIATGVIAAAAREIIEWAKGSRRNARELSYLSVATAAALDGFAIVCRDLEESMEANYKQYRSVGSISIPAPPEFPADCDWRLVEAELLNELFSFANKVRQAQSTASFTSHFEGDRWSHVTAVKDLGGEARALAARLRKDIGLF
ncbi:hypothetical protein [Rhizobium sp. 21-4511-3d]